MRTATSEGLQHYQRLFGDRRETFNRSALPAPLAYLTQRGLVQKKPRGEWIEIRCPAHKNGQEVNPSMRVSAIDGHFKCHTCGVKGHDVIALHRLITGQGFMDAVRELGAAND